MTTSSPAKPLLDLGSLEPKRPTLRIDGADFRYRVDMDLNLVDLARIESVRERVDEMGEEVKASASQKADPARGIRVRELLLEGVGLMMYDPIPDETMAKLNDVQLLAIVDAFTRATLRAALPLSFKARRELLKARPTSSSSSPASSASTRRRTRRSG